MSYPRSSEGLHCILRQQHTAATFAIPRVTTPKVGTGRGGRCSFQSLDCGVLIFYAFLTPRAWRSGPLIVSLFVGGLP